jgi:hypothetical protein
MASSTSNIDLPTPDISVSSVKPKELIPNRQEFDWQDEQAILIRANIRESHPTSPTERLIDLAERVLAHGYSEEGHHESVRKRMEAWVNGRTDTPREDPYRRVVFHLQPRERARFALTGALKEKYEKAVTILAWGIERYGEAQRVS